MPTSETCLLAACERGCDWRHDTHQPKVKRSCAPPSILPSYPQAHRPSLFRTLYPLAVPHPQRGLSNSTRIPIHPTLYHQHIRSVHTSTPYIQDDLHTARHHALAGRARFVTASASAIFDEAEQLDRAGAALLLAEPCLPAHRHAARQRPGGRPGSAQDPKHPRSAMLPPRPHQEGSCRRKCQDNSALPASASKLVGPCPI